MNRRVHCWKDKREWAQETYGNGSPEELAAFEQNGTCMLWERHRGAHIFTPDSQIGVSFLPAEAQS